MNMIQMMQQAQKMQKKFKETQDALANIEITGQSPSCSVDVTCNDQGKFNRIKLKPEAINPETTESVDSDTIEILDT